jgi:uncharacterized protein
MKRRSLIAGVGGAVLTLGAIATYESVRYHVGSPPPSATAAAKPLGEFQVDPSWILAGKPTFRGVETLRSPDGRVVSGLWACDGPTTFVWHFGADETVHLIDGQVEVEYLGRRFSIAPGDTATFHAGTKAIWHVPSHAKKAYTLHHPSLLVRAWRRAVRLVAGQP